MMETFDLRIDAIAAGGDGVGRRDGMVVFVPRAAPGDVARVEARAEGRLMRGQIAELTEASPQRVAPPCGHYVSDRCGGCQIQHLRYETQLSEKSGIIRDALTRIGRMAVDAPEVEPSPRQWRYRRKLTLALRRRNGRWIAGLRRYDAPDDVFELADCPITDEEVVRHWRSVMEHQALLPNGRELRGAVRLLDSGFSFTLEGPDHWPGSARFFDAIPALSELWFVPAGRGQRRLNSRLPANAAGASFMQVNPDVAAALRDWVQSLADDIRPRTVVDAYAGTGDLAAALARPGTTVTAIEIDPDAARVAAGRLPDGSRAIARSVEAALPEALPADLVVLNPPRGGLHPKVAEQLRDDRAARSVIYVSCNPATLARDVRRMERFRVRSLRGFDMFPQTAHVETVCELVPAT